MADSVELVNVDVDVDGCVQCVPSGRESKSRDINISSDGLDVRCLATFLSA